MDLSSKQIGDIANLYENIASFEEREQIDEIAVNFGGQAAVDKARAAQKAKTASDTKLAALRTQRFGSGGAPSAGKDSSGNPAAAKVSAAAPQLKGLSIGKGGFNINNRPVQTGSQKPAGAPAAPSRQASAPSAVKPAAKTAPAGQTGDKAKDMATWAKANPTLAAKVKPGQSGYSEIQKSRAATGGSAAAPAAAKMNTSSITKTAFSGSTPALAKPLSSAAATAATTKPVDTTTPAQSKIAAAPKPVTMGSKKPGSAFEEVEIDVFDTVLEYLLQTGQAETIAEAQYVMTTLHSEAIDNIVEAKYGTAAGRKALAKKIRKGEEVGKSGAGTGFKSVEKAAKAGGVKNPKAVAAAAMWKTYGK